MTKLHRHFSLASISPPLTVPYIRGALPKIERGDIVSVHHSFTLHTLGVVDEAIVDVVSGGQFRVITADHGTVIVRPFSLQFHAKGLVDPMVDSKGLLRFLAHFKKCADALDGSKFKVMQEWLGARKGGYGSDRLITPAELRADCVPCEKNAESDACANFVAHQFLMRQSSLSLDFTHVAVNNAFFRSPEILREVADMAADAFSRQPMLVRSLATKISAGGIHPFNRTDQMLLDFCLQYCLKPTIERWRNPVHSRIVRSLLDPLRSESDILSRLLTIPGFVLPFSDVLFQAGGMHGDGDTFDKLTASHMYVGPLIKSKGPAEDMREDFTDPAIAIDDDETVEVDDAISFRQQGDSDVVIVHVADPTDLIDRDSSLDSVARKRVSTAYFPERVFPMLPSAIVQRTSLDPGKPRSALSFFLRLSDSGDIVDVQVKPTRLHNIRRMNYQDAESFSKTSGGLQALMSATDRHRAIRKEKGFADIQIPKNKVRVRQGKVSITPQYKGIGQAVVSECMVMAGRAAAMLLRDNNVPAPFRYLTPLSELDIGLPFDAAAIPEAADPIAAAFGVLSDLVASAVDIMPRRHHPMGLDAYVKVTSPLRRYFDMLAHRQIKSLLGLERAYTAHDLSFIIPPVYKHEQYLRRLQRAAERFWVNVHMHQLILKGPLELDGVFLGGDINSSAVRIFLDFPACMDYSQARVWGSRYGPNRNQSFTQVAIVGQRYRFRVLEVGLQRSYIVLEAQM